MLNLYNTTSRIQENTVFNRGIMDLGGVALPQAAMANNHVEAVERSAKSFFYFFVAFMSPFVTLPLSNKFALSKVFKITKNFNSKENEIIQLSYDYLKGSTQHMIKGIKELSQKLTEKDKNFKGFDTILQKYKGKEELLKEQLVKAKTNVFGSDYLFTGFLMGSNPWIMNELTKKFTGRTGYSGEYEMANDNYTKANAREHEKNKLKKYLTFVGATLAQAILFPLVLKKSLLAKDPKGFLKIIKEKTPSFDYTGGKFMKMLPFFMLTTMCEIPSILLSSRDALEAKDWAIRLSVITAAFFGGDAALNSITGRFMDKFLGTKIIDREKMQKGTVISKLFPPIKRLDDIEKIKGISKDTLNKTKKLGLTMYWGNLGVIMLFLGIGLPKILNAMLKENVESDLKGKEAFDSYSSILQRIKKDYPEIFSHAGA